MSPPLALAAVVFDLDGTLIDSVPGIEFSVDYALTEAKMAPRSRKLGSLIGPPIRQILAQLLPEIDDQQLSQIEQAFRTCYDSAGWRKTMLYPNAADVLSHLKAAGLKLFVATNKPTFPTRRILEALGLYSFFTEVLCRDSRTPAFLSKAEMLRSLIAAHRLEAEQCLYVGDTYEDRLAGAEAGIRVALVQHSCQNNGHVLTSPPDRVLTGLLELLDEIKIKETA